MLHFNYFLFIFNNFLKELLLINKLNDSIIFRKVLGKLKRNLNEEIINQELRMKRNLAQIIKNWKKVSKDKIITKFVFVDL